MTSVRSPTLKELSVQWESPRHGLQSPMGTEHCPGLGGAVTDSRAPATAPSGQEEQEQERGPWGPGSLWSCSHSHSLFNPGIDDDMVLFGK